MGQRKRYVAARAGMPIKFRCTHCQQFLGISRAQSGSVVDCPACGRSIRVPNLDGTIAPLPKPAIDLNDSGLATALEQLASLQQGVAEIPPEPPFREAAASVTAAPPVIAVPVAPPVASPSDAATMAGPGSLPRPWLEVDEQLAILAEEAPETRLVESTRGLTRRDLFVAASTAAAVAPLTWWLSRRSHRGPDIAVAAAPAAQQEAVNPPVPPDADHSPLALTGRITYVTADGESRPDARARVLIFPEIRQGTTQLSIDGFRADAADADLQLARESMKLSGGAYVLADELGRYGANLSSSGTYQILMISNYQSRPAGPLPADLQKALARYFDRPQQLIGQRAYEFTHLRFTGREPAVRDQVFQRV